MQTVALFVAALALGVSIAENFRGDTSGDIIPAPRELGGRRLDQYSSSCAGLGIYSNTPVINITSAPIGLLSGTTGQFSAGSSVYVGQAHGFAMTPYCGNSALFTTARVSP